MSHVFAYFLLVILVSLHSAKPLGIDGKPRKWIIPEKVPFGDISRLLLDADEDDHEVEGKDSPATAKDNKVVVATRAVGLNFADIFTVLGYYNAANLVRGNKEQRAFCPGLEFAGVVTNNCDDFSQGDRVFGFTRFDAYADQVMASPRVLRKLPNEWTFAQGAAFLVNALTAWHGLVTVAGMPQKGNKSDKEHPMVVVVHSAVGGVGLYACEIAARRGALVVGVAGSWHKLATFRDRIQPLCPEAQCIVRSPDANQFAKDLLNAIVKVRSTRLGVLDPPLPIETAEDAVAVNWGADYVMESYGGKYFQPSLDLINAGGSLATYGSTTYNGKAGGNRLSFLPLAWQFLNRPKVDPGELTSRNIRVGGFNLIFLTERTERLSEGLSQCIDCLEGGAADGSLASATPPVLGGVFPFEQAPDALRALRSGQTVGKVVLSNDSNPLLREKV
ncbi:Synaptic vesicle membrane protein VAT-1 homolog [Seminavis robusta]|uniref:Synaptic vesicle membrane protein VAT-1 homolog n=1 Tax=Seminavis robusta TaxID=568900 RepID=A0A9N8EF75_9STRA|nr:Synaptic vesicle membrane protein VAT-1 homolog [Seminavis robusta]|eukprot:Sro989_g228530.1 Synaptic vesicle membrane protein VAT-1 homolog (446) ;mRNA; f:33049-34386